MNRPKPISPKDGQESVWDYPRPPKLERTSKLIEVFLHGECIARTNEAYRVLETSHPPNYYLPPLAVRTEFFVPSVHQTYCEWKGKGSYYHIKLGNQLVENAAWYYDSPTRAFAEIAHYFSFYAFKMDECRVNGEIVIPQPGEFYGGWITQDIVGPFKGVPGSWGW